MTNFTAIHHVCNAGENKTLKRILSLKIIEANGGITREKDIESFVMRETSWP
ncbi:hypothetical protein [Thiothrix nivea]|uniref:hypothetical protein n=1 Tax=Thiothrix nivea TaxID=1031 RepID=UPI0002FC3826|nr:hypothetical protein [Thiothrix nivea]